jgi:hypothetical protein
MKRTTAAAAPTPTDHNPDGVPDSAEFGLWRSFLARQRIPQREIDAALGSNVNGRKRSEIAASFRAWAQSQTR